MKNVNVFDFNNLAIRHFFRPEIESKSENPDYSLWKYYVIESIASSLFKGNINEIIIAIDSPVSWRKLKWNRYKEDRKTKRDESEVDWNRLHKELDDAIDDIKLHLPFKMIKTKYAEADDIIAVICMNRKNNYTIISTDEDFLQLSSENIKIYHPLRQKFVECDNTENFIIKKSLTGQAKDGIFNVKTPIDWPSDKRKPGFGEKGAEKVMKEGLQEWLKKEKLEERFELNRTLMDFNRIPGSVKDIILKNYDEYDLPDGEKIYGFFKKNKMKSFLDDYTKYENKILELY